MTDRPKCQCGSDMYAGSSGWTCLECDAKIISYSMKPRPPVQDILHDNDLDPDLCDECDGTGSVDCLHCDGDGYTECDHCGSEVDCKYCDGEGHEECKACEGRGTLERKAAKCNAQ